MHAACTASGRMPRALRILVVDDEPLFRDCVSAFFRSWGHEVKAVGTAWEALTAARSFAPDVALVDWRLPGGGSTVVEGLRGDDTFNGRIFLVTGSIDGGQACLGLGVECITKPFSYPGLLALVEERKAS